MAISAAERLIVTFVVTAGVDHVLSRRMAHPADGWMGQWSQHSLPVSTNVVQPHQLLLADHQTTGGSRTLGHILERPETARTRRYWSRRDANYK